MREIKFRAWDKEVNVMVEIVSLVQPKQAPFCLVRGPTDDIARAARTSDLEIVQYTGLKDKNDKEIWEGDIIHVFRTDSMPSYENQVYFSKGGFFTEAKDLTQKSKLRAVPIWYWENEVIGNIHENKELLK